MCPIEVCRQLEVKEGSYEWEAPQSPTIVPCSTFVETLAYNEAII